MSTDTFLNQGIYWLIGAVIVMIGLIVVMVQLRRRKNPSELIGTGLPAQATVLACRATGKQTPTGPELALILHVQLPNQVPYQATTYTSGQPYEPAFQVGKEVQAWVDRRNHQRVAVIPSTVMSGGGAGFGGSGFTADSNFTTNSNFTATTINVDGVTYTDPNQLPPELRQKFNQAMGMLKDADGDGVPDIFNHGQWDRQAESLKAVESLKWMVKNGKMSQSHALQGLQGLLDSGSIPQAVYDAARMELLRS